LVLWLAKTAIRAISGSFVKPYFGQMTEISAKTSLYGTDYGTKSDLKTHGMKTKGIANLSFTDIVYRDDKIVRR
jgi:hypothetical protein